MKLPRARSNTEWALFLAVMLSPLFVLVHFAYRQVTNSYPSDGDSIAIPIFTYWILVFPCFAFITFIGREGLELPRKWVIWNPRMHVTSAIFTMLAIYPVGAFLVFILSDAIAGSSTISIAYAAALFWALIVYLAGAIG